MLSLRPLRPLAASLLLRCRLPYQTELSPAVRPGGGGPDAQISDHGGYADVEHVVVDFGARWSRPARDHLALERAVPAAVSRTPAGITSATTSRINAASIRASRGAFEQIERSAANAADQVARGELVDFVHQRVVDRGR